MNFNSYQCFLVCSLLIAVANAFDTNNALSYALRQYTQLSQQLEESDQSQFITTADPVSTTWYTTGISGWTVGFYGGTLWTLYNLTMDNYWKELAIEYQRRVASRQYNPSDHDVGFVIMSTYGLCLEYTGDTSTIAVINQAATTLSERFHPLVRAIRSWDNWDGVNEVKVIADNMMNLELLFRATELSGNTTFSSIATSHADRTIQDHFRNDGKDGTFHVVGYEETTGDVSRKYNVQGLRDNSTWSRGLAWVTHGYVTSYIKTNNDNYLKYAEIAADYFISHLPPDFVAFWDFDADNVTQYQPRDTAAAAIASHALLKLYTVTENEKYFTVADSILENLNNLYRSDGNDAYQIHSILVNGTVHYHDGNLNTAIVYGDFYFLQALKLYREIEASMRSSSNAIGVIGKIVLSQVTLLGFVAKRWLFSV